MKIKQITNQYRNDFSAIMVCEHCEHEQKLTSGYDDANYHINVIPKMLCVSCKRDRSGKPSPVLIIDWSDDGPKEGKDEPDV